jgi:hypothetical protein
MDIIYGTYVFDLHIYLTLNNMIISGLFALELTSRVYTLRAKSNAEAELWVKTLSKLRAQGSLSTLNPTGICLHIRMQIEFVYFYIVFLYVYVFVT